LRKVSDVPGFPLILEVPGDDAAAPPAPTVQGKVPPEIVTLSAELYDPAPPPAAAHDVGLLTAPPLPPGPSVSIKLSALFHVPGVEGFVDPVVVTKDC
jgi:hypothetical protein